MATVVNFIDVTLGGAAARTVNLPTAQILLTPSAPAFHQAANGTITPASITFTATLIDLDAALTFNCTGGTLTNIAAKSVTLAGADMVGSSATVIASATVNGVLYTGPCTISKFSDGKDGKDADGSNLTPGDLKAILEGQLTTDELDAALRGRIGLIDAGADTAGSVTARVKASTDAAMAAISQEASDRRTYVQDYAYSKQEYNQSLSAFGTSIQAAYQGYADTAAGNALAAARAYAQSYAYSKADSDSALTATANTLRSEFATLNQGTGATVAWVQEYAYSKAQANEAIASATQQLSTTVVGHTTTLEIQGQSISGLGAQYTVKIDNNGYMAGYGLASTPINGVPTSSFIVLADRFAVALPGQTAKYPFAIGKVNGQQTIAFNGAIIADGSFTFRDANGKVLLSVGVPLDPSLAAPGTLNSDIKIGGRNLLVDSGFERGKHTFVDGVGYSALQTNLPNGLTAYDGEKALYMDGNGLDMYSYLGTRVAVEPGREYRISFYSMSATAGVIHDSSSYLRMWDKYSNALGHFYLPIANLGTYAWNREVASFICPAGVYFIEPRFGIRTNGAFSWLIIDCIKIEEGNSETAWTPAPEDAAADIAAAKAAADAANSAIPGINSAISDKLSKTTASDLAATVTIQTGGTLLAGTPNNGVYWNATGIYLVQNGVVRGSLPISGDPTFAGQLMAAFGTFGAIKLAPGGYIASGDYFQYNWPAQKTPGFYLGPEGMLMGVYDDGTGQFFELHSDGRMYMNGFRYENKQLTLTRPIIIDPTLNNPNFGTFTVNLGGNWSGGGSGKSISLGSRTASIVGGTDPKTIKWTVENANANDGTNSANIFISAGQGTPTVTLRSSTGQPPAFGYAILTCTVTSANGLVATDSIDVDSMHG